MKARGGVALVAVLALLSCVVMLLLATSMHLTATWLAARNLREGTIAWSRAESAAAAAVSALAETYRRDGDLPVTFALSGAEEMGVTLGYARTSQATATLDVFGEFRRAAVRHEIRVDMRR